ncbi:PxKF domain-containing protein [Intrasporangium chromatireducens]|uniref:PxKF domain-containing protein n=1 Tax=Intrasporangium chromatireducens TaxID=1386088 RepID=UPI0012DC6065|nr:PxKF domain-containing protein [Intrasporangium chromatireducens]
MAGASGAIADDITNDIISPTKLMTLAINGSGTTVLSIDEKNDDGKNGCNLTGNSDGEKAYFTASVDSSSVAVATVMPARITFTSCGQQIPITVEARGTGTATITLGQLGQHAQGSFNVAPATFTVVVTGPSNTAPSTPGAPTASANPTQGGFTLNWAASSDAEGDAFTYTLEGKDSSGMAWAQVAEKISGTSYNFGAGAPAEGTWTYRVKAVETGASSALSSDWSASSTPVVVDRSGPNAPLASAGEPAYVGGDKSWWKDSATVTFSDNGDPSLPDRSSGSGVLRWTEPQTFLAQGLFTALGTATDAAGNESDETVFSGYVDTEAPTVTMSCPTDPVVLGSTSTADWSATDEGGSGVAGTDSGSVAIDTSAIGSHTATLDAGAVRDNVGHESVAATCEYKVVFDFSGFFRPVIDGLNVVKAGSAVPIKFSLHGDQGLDIIAAGSPTFTMTGAAAVKTVTSGQSSLSYDPTTDQYTYVWKTDKAWAGKSGTFTLKLVDGTEHTAQFSFTK